MSPFEQGFCRSAPWRWFVRLVPGGFTARFDLEKR
jgi:hypothetical protein